MENIIHERKKNKLCSINTKTKTIFDHKNSLKYYIRTFRI